MKKYGKKGFTLIELIAVLVIMAIIALIATPLVMSIIRKARISADKRSIDAYGRSIELAIAGYLLDNGKFPTEVSQLTIEYSGNEVVCSTTQINTDSSIYLAGCTVNGRSVEYTYGKEEVVTYNAYEVRDTVTYNNIDYYVIKDSSSSEDSVTLLKAEPLSVAEVNQFGSGHVNRYTSDSVGTAYDCGGYGCMAYYSSETCGYANNNYVNTGCTTNYADSDIKYVVDAWKTAKAPAAIEARLIQYDELIDNLGYDQATWNVSNWNVNPDYTPSWVYDFTTRTMSQYNDSMDAIWDVLTNGNLRHSGVSGFDIPVRPVIVLPKSAL